MKAFVTYDQLKNYSGRDDARSLFESATKTYGKTVFLSHSSKDHDLVAGVVLILENHGGRVYVDERDPELSNTDFQQTAERIRNVVTACRKFVLFVTERSRNSKWIPWELGLGDGSKKEHNVALFPSAEKFYEQSWSEQEYLGLYDRIIWGNIESKELEWLVLDHRGNTAIPLGEWLRQ
jgi:hypothetical protein